LILACELCCVPFLSRFGNAFIAPIRASGFVVVQLFAIIYFEDYVSVSQVVGHECLYVDMIIVLATIIDQMW
jgi:uncharacterized membrane protein